MPRKTVPRLPKRKTLVIVKAKILAVDMGFHATDPELLGIKLLLRDDKGEQYLLEDMTRPNGERSQFTDACALTFTTMFKMLKDAGKNNISELAGVPVEMMFENSVLKTWIIQKG